VKDLSRKGMRITAVLAVAVFCFGGCRANNAGSEGKGQVPKSVEQALKEHSGRLLSLPGVVGTGEGVSNGKPCIIVYVVRASAALTREIPASLDGYSVVIEETGEVRALPGNREKKRP